MALRYVAPDFPRRIAFAPKGSTIVIVNQDNLTDVYITATEEELRNVPRTQTGGDQPLLNNGTIGIKIAAAGGQLNWVDYPGQLYAMASGGVGANGNVATYIRVLPG